MKTTIVNPRDLKTSDLRASTYIKIEVTWADLEELSNLRRRRDYHLGRLTQIDARERKLFGKYLET